MDIYISNRPICEVSVGRLTGSLASDWHSSDLNHRSLDLSCMFIFVQTFYLTRNHELGTLRVTNPRAFLFWLGTWIKGVFDYTDIWTCCGDRSTRVSGTRAKRISVWDFRIKSQSGFKTSGLPPKEALCSWRLFVDPNYYGFRTFKLLLGSHNLQSLFGILWNSFRSQLFAEFPQGTTSSYISFERLRHKPSHL